MTTVTVDVPANLWVTSNSRLHWRVKARRVRALRRLAHMLVKTRRIPPMGRTHHHPARHPRPHTPGRTHSMTTLTDLFCGAGGSSTGAALVDGIQVTMAANHWRLAIDTHQANHPNTSHDCADLSQVDPRRYPTTDILWASPSCTNHSIAKGIASQRQAEAQRGDLLGLLDGDDAA